MVRHRFGKRAHRSDRLGSDLNGVRYAVVEELSIALNVFYTSSDNGCEVRTSLDASVFGVAAIEPEFDLSCASLIGKAGIVESSAATRVVNAYDV